MFQGGCCLGNRFKEEQGREWKGEKGSARRGGEEKSREGREGGGAGSPGEAHGEEERERAGKGGAGGRPAWFSSQLEKRNPMLTCGPFVCSDLAVGELTRRSLMLRGIPPQHALKWYAGLTRWARGPSIRFPLSG